MLKIIRSRGLVFLLSVLFIPAVSAGVLDSELAVKNHAERLSRLLKEIGIDVADEELLELIEFGEDRPDIMRIMGCLRGHGAVPELAIPSEAEITTSTRPMLIRTKDAQWYAFRSSAEGLLRPAVGAEAPEAKVRFEAFQRFWSGLAIFVSPIEQGRRVPKPAEMKFKAEENGFGRVPRGKVVEVEFPFQNTGERPLRVKKAETEEKAIEVRASPDLREFPPGASGVLVVRYDTSTVHGTVAVNAELMTNDPERMFYSLSLTGEVVDPVTAIPDRVEFAPIVKGATAAQLVHLMSFGGSPFRVSNVSTDQPFVKASVFRNRPATGPKVPITVVADSSEMEVGAFKATCTIEMAPAKFGVVTLGVSGEVVPPR